MSTQSECLVKVVGELVVHTRRDLKERFLQLFEAGERHFSVDLTLCTHFDSSGVGVLVFIDKKAKESGGSVELLNPPKDLLEFLEVTKLDELLTIRISRAV